MLEKARHALHVLRRELALALFSAALYFIGFCGYEQLYLSWVCLVPILWALAGPTLTGRQALLVSWVFGLITHMGGYYWIVGLLKTFGHLPLPLALLGYFLLCLAQGSLLAVWGYAVHHVHRRLGVPITLAAPVIMVVCEWAYPALFPSYLANSQYRWLTFIQSLDIWGPLGLTFILTLSSAVLYESIAWRLGRRPKAPVRAAAVFALLFAANLLYGALRIADVDDTVAHADRRVTVGMVQTNMDIFEKHKNRREGLIRHQKQSIEVIRQGADLVVWPESGYNYALTDEHTNVKARVLGPIDKPLLFGGLRLTGSGENERLYNSAFLVDGAGNVQGSYDKIYLLAFGEYIPLGDVFPWLYELSPQTSRFYRGSHTNPLVLDGLKYGVLICYEDILPGFVRRVMRHEPDILVNLTNDSWFGDTIEPAIHLALATFRSVEHRRFLVRSTNTGISAFVDPVGRILAQTPTFRRANLVHTVTALQGRTLYARVGDVAGWLCALVLTWWLGQLWRRRRRPQPTGDSPRPARS